MLPYGRQFIDQLDIDEVTRVLRSDYLTTGPEIAELEATMREATGAGYAVACSNGTAALHLIGMALDLKPGDQVIVPSISFVATANGPHYCGAEVVFADVDPSSSLMTPETLEEAVIRADADRLKAIFVVHMGGHPADMPALKAVAERMGVSLVEDACHALGSYYQTDDGQSHKIGACDHSDFATLSLHPVKTVTCGEGGVVFTPHKYHAESMQLKRSHGLIRDPEQWQNHDMGFDSAEGGPNSWYYELQELGYNYRLTDFQAAMARSQMAKLPMFAERRRTLVSLYHQQIDNKFNHIQLQQSDVRTDPVLHLMIALFDFEAIGKTRQQVMEQLHSLNVGTQVHYVPIHRQPYYSDLNEGLSLPGADVYYSRCLSLPLYPGMEDEDVATVVTALREVVGQSEG